MSFGGVYCTQPTFPMSTSSVCSDIQVKKSRISVGWPSGSRRNQPTTGIRAFYAPAAEGAETLYDVLGVGENGTVLDIKKAYKQMARKYHPDVSPPDRVDEYTRRFIVVQEAYHTLSNPTSRALYDKDLAKGLRFGGSYNDERRAEAGGWKLRWQTQLDELKKRDSSKDSRGSNMSWGARMRSQR